MKMCNSFLAFLLLLSSGLSVAQGAVEVSLQECQKAALKILANNMELGDELRNIAKNKLSFFSETAEGTQMREEPLTSALLTSTPFAAMSFASTMAERTQGAAEFALTSFTSPYYDPDFRKYLIKFLGQSTLSGQSTLEMLLPLARGLSQIQFREIKWAGIAVSEISQRLGSYPARYSSQSSGRYGSQAEMLRYEPIKSIKTLGGGINGTLLVEFENLEKAVFKPLRQEREFARGNYDARWINFIRDWHGPGDCTVNQIGLGRTGAFCRCRLGF